MGLIMKNGVSYGGGGGSSKGGHIIQNGSGTELPQRDTLQFGGYLITTDDSTNSKTVVKDVEEVTWTAWQNMTDEQKAGKHWIITNAPESMTSDQAIIGIYGQELTFTNLVATIQDKRIEANDAVLVYFSNDSVAEAAGITTTWDTGVITFTASTAPSSTLTVNVYIIKPALASPRENITADDIEYDSNTTVKTAIDGKVDKSGDTINGNLTVDLKNGTTSTEGISRLYLGNEIPKGTDKNSTGLIQMYGDSGKYIQIYPNGDLSANRWIGFPDKTGTVALLTDISYRTYYVYNDTYNATYTITVPERGAVATIILKHSGGTNMWHGMWLDAELLPLNEVGGAFNVSLIDSKTIVISAPIQYYRLGILCNQPLTVTKS